MSDYKCIVKVNELNGYTVHRDSYKWKTQIGEIMRRVRQTIGIRTYDQLIVHKYSNQILSATTDLLSLISAEKKDKLYGGTLELDVIYAPYRGTYILSVYLLVNNSLYSIFPRAVCSGSFNVYRIKKCIEKVLHRRFLPIETIHPEYLVISDMENNNLNDDLTLNDIEPTQGLELKDNIPNIYLFAEIDSSRSIHRSIRDIKD